jgi:NADPH:quinone reductase-like Zn-dependent oxidoreductase
MLRDRTTEEKAAVARAVEEHALPLMAGGQVQVPVAEQLPMESAADAYERFAAGGKFGKIVLVTG